MRKVKTTLAVTLALLTLTIQTAAAAGSPSRSRAQIAQQAVLATAVDDSFPGASLPPSPFSGTLADGSDYSDIYSVFLQAGQTFQCTMTGATGTDFDLYLYPPGTTTFSGAVAHAAGSSYPESLTYAVQTSGVYYLEAYAYSGYGSYTLSYSKTAPADSTPPVVSCNPAVSYWEMASIQVSASDSGSGVKSVNYILDSDAPVNVPGSSASVTVTQAGTHSIQVWAEDNAGNTSASVTRYFTVLNDNGFPGQAISPSPIFGSLDSESDYVDFYAIDLAEGQRLDVTMQGDAGTDFDLALWRPGTSEYRDDDMVAWSYSYGSNESFQHRAASSGRYGLMVIAYSGQGQYGVEYAVRKSTVDCGLVRSTANPAYNTKVLLSASLTDEDGTAVVGRTAIFERQSGSTWVRVGEVATDSNGDASLSVMPYANSKTVYRAVFAGDAGFANATSGSVSVVPRPYVGTPYLPASIRSGSSVTITGYLKPRHTAGTYPVRIYAWYWTGSSWKSVGYKTARVSNYSSYSKYARSITPRGASRWRFRAYHPADSRHVAAWSGYRYLTVK